MGKLSDQIAQITTDADGAFEQAQQAGESIRQRLAAMQLHVDTGDPLSEHDSAAIKAVQSKAEALVALQPTNQNAAGPPSAPTTPAEDKDKAAPKPAPGKRTPT